jgi:hypothetical protein
MNWQMRLTAKEISDRVRDKYWRAPTMMWYQVESSGDNGVP